MELSRQGALVVFLIGFVPGAAWGFYKSDWLGAVVVGGFIGGILLGLVELALSK